MGTQEAQLGQALQGFGQTLVQSALTLNEIDAKQQADQAELAIAGQIEEFKRSLLSDPNHGTPGQNDGYMKRWNDKIAEIRSSTLSKVTNPLAQRQISNSLESMAQSQASSIYSLQYQAWGKDTVAGRQQMIKQRAETSGLGVQEQLDLAAQDLDFCVQANLIDKATRDEQMANWSQVIMRKSLVDQAKAAYKGGGTAAAQKLILGDATAYVPSKATEAYHAALSSIQGKADTEVRDAQAEYNAAVQEIADARAEKAQTQAMPGSMEQEAAEELDLAKQEQAAAAKRDARVQAALLGQKGESDAALASYKQEQTEWGPYIAGDKVKAAAIQDIADLDAVVEAEAGADFEAAWANSVGYVRGGAKPGAVLSVDMIQNYKTADGFSPSAKTKEYWIARLASLSNGKATGDGSEQARIAKLYLGQAEKIAGALSQAKNGVLSNNAAVAAYSPSGKLIVQGVNRDVLVALGKDKGFCAAMDAAGTWGDFYKLLDSVDHPSGDTTGQAAVAYLKKRLEGKPGLTAALAGLAEYQKGAGQSASIAQVQEFIDKKLLGPAYKVAVEQLFDVAWTGNQYNGSIDQFARDCQDGQFSDLVVVDAQGRGAITNPNYAPNYNRAMGQIQAALQRQGLKTEPLVTGDGTPAFIGRAKDLKDVDLPAVNIGLTPAEKRAGKKATPTDVVYMVSPVSQNRDARIIRDLTYGDNFHALQSYEIIGGKGQWIDVYLQQGGKGGYYQYKNPEDFSKMLENQGGEKMPENPVDLYGKKPASANLVDAAAELLNGGKR